MTPGQNRGRNWRFPFNLLLHFSLNNVDPWALMRFAPRGVHQFLFAKLFFVLIDDRCRRGFLKRPEEQGRVVEHPPGFYVNK